MDLDTKLRKAHLVLMRHPETCLYSGVIMMGKATIEKKISTACTDGVNTKYGEAFMQELTFPETVGIVLHENLHKALKHVFRHKGLFKEDPQTANAAVDYVTNGIIMDLQDKEFCKLPASRLYDPRFRNWSVLEVWDYLKSGNPPPPPPGGGGNKQNGKGKGNGQPLPQGKPKRGPSSVGIGNEDFELGGFDDHDTTAAENATPEELREMSEAINEALQQGGMLAGRFGAKIPRVIKDLLTPKVDWKTVLSQFITSAIKGNDEYTYRKYNKRRLADDYYLPSTESEAVGEVIISIDTSGSIGGAELSRFATEVASICTMCNPEKVRVLWWDTRVHGEQVFEGNYTAIERMLKPKGGGGTHAGCVSDYLKGKEISADCVVMFTDGYCEGNIKWEITTPTLWLISENGYGGFTPPAGGTMVKMERA